MNKVIDNYLQKSDWRVKENSNMAYSLQGLNIQVAEAAIKNYWLTSIYPERLAKLHKDGDLHIHDLGTLGAYCVGWDLMDLIKNGFGGVRGKVSSRAPKRFRVALLQIVNFIYTLQGESAGAQALSNFDTLLAPFVKNENLSYEEVKQTMQEFVFNMNVPTRVGFQSPFSNCTFDLTVPHYLEKLPAIVGGNLMPFTYGEVQKEMDMINRAFAETMLAGDAVGRPFAFPIPTYNITKDFRWGDPQFNAIWEMTAKYGTPYFSNFINSDMNPEDARSMCCRLRINNGDLRKRGGGLFGSHPKTGSIGVVTINLPRIARNSKSVDEFFSNLGKLMIDAKELLVIKRILIESLSNKGLYPYSSVYLKDIKDSTGGYWNNHFSTIGVIGANEAGEFLGIGGTDTIDGHDFAVSVLEFMRKNLSEFQHDTGNLFNLEATPAEGASRSLAEKDGHKNPYYTNSTQLPVNHKMNLFDALDMQDDLQSLYTGGSVFHAFVGERFPSPKSVENLVRTIAENYTLPYFSITPTFSICQEHGYIVGEKHECPNCGKKTEVYSRVVGYIRPVEQWNEGKAAEFFERTVFTNEGEIYTRS